MALVGVPVPKHGVITSREQAMQLAPEDRIFKRIESTVNRETEIHVVKRGEALKEAMKPELVVPSMPTPSFTAPTVLSDERAMLQLAAEASAERR